MKPDVATVYVDAFNLDAVRSMIDNLAIEHARLTALARELAEALRFEIDCHDCTGSNARMLGRPDVRVLLDREDQP